MAVWEKYDVDAAQGEAGVIAKYSRRCLSRPQSLRAADTFSVITLTSCLHSCQLPTTFVIVVLLMRMLLEKPKSASSLMLT